MISFLWSLLNSWILSNICLIDLIEIFEWKLKLILDLEEELLEWFVLFFLSDWQLFGNPLDSQDFIIRKLPNLVWRFLFFLVINIWNWSQYGVDTKIEAGYDTCSIHNLLIDLNFCDWGVNFSVVNGLISIEILSLNIRINSPIKYKNYSFELY